MADRLLGEEVNVYIENLPLNVDNSRLEREFSRFGRIVSAIVMTNAGRSKGYGFVCFAAAADAENAIREMNGQLLEGRQLYVAIAERQRLPLELGQFFPAGPNRGYYDPLLPPGFYRPDQMSVFKLPRWTPPAETRHVQEEPPMFAPAQSPTPPPPLMSAPPLPLMPASSLPLLPGPPLALTPAPPLPLMPAPPLMHVPPAQMHVPPAQMYAPPAQMHAPPAQMHAPPAQMHAPPAQMHAPPPQMHAPPPLMHAPPPLMHAPPPLMHVPSSLMHVPPPLMHVPPPLMHVSSPPPPQYEQFSVPPYMPCVLPPGGQFVVPPYGQFTIPSAGQFAVPPYMQCALPPGGQFGVPPHGQLAFPTYGQFAVPPFGQFLVSSDGQFMVTPCDQFAVSPYEGPSGMLYCEPVYNNVENLPVPQTIPADLQVNQQPDPQVNLQADPQPGPSELLNTGLRPIPKNNYLPPHVLLTKEILDTAPPYKRKEIIRKELYPLIQNMYPYWANNVTAILLELSNEELLSLLHDEESLQKRATEAANLYCEIRFAEYQEAAARKE